MSATQAPARYSLRSAGHVIEQAAHSAADSGVKLETSATQDTSQRRSSPSPVREQPAASVAAPDRPRSPPASSDAEPKESRREKYVPPGKRHRHKGHPGDANKHNQHGDSRPFAGRYKSREEGPMDGFRKRSPQRWGPVNDQASKDDPAWKHEETVNHVFPIPVPSAAYMQRCDAGYTTEVVGRKLIILDLNGALVCRGGSHKDKHRELHPRPGLTRFLKWAMANHFVMIWSSATPKSVGGMLRGVTESDIQEGFIAIWARDTLGIPPEFYSRKIQTYKNLELVWQHPNIKVVRDFSQDDTIIIDDSRDKVLQHPHNHIFIPTFDEAAAAQDNDTALEQITTYLKELEKVSNVSAVRLLCQRCRSLTDNQQYIKQNPPEITVPSLTGGLQKHDATVSAEVSTE